MGRQVMGVGGLSETGTDSSDQNLPESAGTRRLGDRGAGLDTDCRHHGRGGGPHRPAGDRSPVPARCPGPSRVGPGPGGAGLRPGRDGCRLPADRPQRPLAHPQRDPPRRRPVHHAADALRPRAGARGRDPAGLAEPAQPSQARVQPRAVRARGSDRRGSVPARARRRGATEPPGLAGCRRCGGHERPAGNDADHAGHRRAHRDPAAAGAGRHPVRPARSARQRQLRAGPRLRGHGRLARGVDRRRRGRRTRAGSALAAQPAPAHREPGAARPVHRRDGGAARRRRGCTGGDHLDQPWPQGRGRGADPHRGLRRSRTPVADPVRRSGGRVLRRGVGGCSRAVAARRAAAGGSSDP